MNIIPLEKKESLYIGNTIQITVRKIYSSGDVELGIDAPENIEVHREKLQLNSISE